MEKPSLCTTHIYIHIYIHLFVLPFFIIIYLIESVTRSLQKKKKKNERRIRNDRDPDFFFFCLFASFLPLEKQVKQSSFLQLCQSFVGNYEKNRTEKKNKKNAIDSFCLDY